MSNAVKKSPFLFPRDSRVSFYHTFINNISLPSVLAPATIVPLKFLFLLFTVCCVINVTISI